LEAVLEKLYIRSCTSTGQRLHRSLHKLKMHQAKAPHQNEGQSTLQSTWDDLQLRPSAAAKLEPYDQPQFANAMRRSQPVLRMLRQHAPSSLLTPQNCTAAAAVTQLNAAAFRVAQGIAMLLYNAM
jgi:hypothetical protein